MIEMTDGARTARAPGMSVPRHVVVDPAEAERWVPEPPKDTGFGRRPFERDRARVLHSAAFRRLAAKTQVEKGNPAAAKVPLEWVAQHAGDEGYQAVARLRLAAIAMEAKAHDEALKHLSGTFPGEFAGVVADRRGDVLALQGKKTEAKAEYLKAYAALDERPEYRRTVEIKLAALGGEVKQVAEAAPAASGAAKP